MKTQNLASLVGLALGSVVGGTLSYGIYGTLRDKQWNPWAAGAVTGGTSAVLGVGLAIVANKLMGGSATPSTGALPKASNLRVLSKGLVTTAVGALTPGVPKLGPVSVGAYVSNPVGAYTVKQVGCANC